MTLTEALGIRPGVTALVGAGGKTSALLQLARELRSAGHTVAITTTTHIFPPARRPVRRSAIQPERGGTGRSRTARHLRGGAGAGRKGQADRPGRGRHRDAGDAACGSG